MPLSSVEGNKKMHGLRIYLGGKTLPVWSHKMGSAGSGAISRQMYPILLKKKKSSYTASRNQVF